MKYVVNDGCIGCGICTFTCPEVFTMGDDGIATAILGEVPEEVLGSAKEVKGSCPVGAIEEAILTVSRFEKIIDKSKRSNPVITHHPQQQPVQQKVTMQPQIQQQINLHPQPQPQITFAAATPRFEQVDFKDDELISKHIVANLQVMPEYVHQFKHMLHHMCETLDEVDAKAGRTEPSRFAFVAFYNTDYWMLQSIDGNNNFIPNTDLGYMAIVMDPFHGITEPKMYFHPQTPSVIKPPADFFVFQDEEIGEHFVIGPNVQVPKEMTEEFSSIVNDILQEINKRVDIHKIKKFAFTWFRQIDKWKAETVDDLGIVLASTDNSYQRIVMDGNKVRWYSAGGIH